MYLKKNKNIYVICIYFIIFISISSLILVKIFKEKPSNQKAQKLKNDKVTEALKETSNPDIKGLLQIEGTNINELIVQGKDNDYYLNHNIYKRPDKKGSLFLDYRVTLASKKILIYGHTSNEETVPFNTLEKYYDKTFFDNHKYIKVTTKKDSKTYEIFSVVIETSDWDYVNINFATTKDWYIHLTKWKAKSIYETNVNISENDSIIILQTCSNHQDYKEYKKKYLLIIGKEL